MADEPLNPYASPQNLDAVLPSPAQRPLAAYFRPYQSARGKATLAVWAAAISLVLQVIMLGSCYLQLSLLQGAQNGAGLDQAEADANDARQQSIVVGVVIAALASLVTLLIWIYAAHANLSALGCRDIAFTPSWAVGWFFVPLLNLFKPYQVVSEIWLGSDPASRLRTIPSGTALIGWWWGLRICSGIMGRLSNMISRHTDTIDGLIGITWLAMILIVAVDIPMLILQAVLILKVQGFQDERHALVEAEPQVTLPDDSASPLATFR